MKPGTAARALNYVSHTASVTCSFLITVRPEVEEVGSRLRKKGICGEMSILHDVCNCAFWHARGR